MKAAVIVAVSIALLFPLYYMAVGSLMPLAGVISVPPKLLPRMLTLENYAALFEQAPILVWAANTALIAVSAAAISIALTATAGYAFGRYRFRGREAIFWTLMASVMIPAQAMFVPKFALIRALGLGGTRWSVILPGALSPVFIYLFRNYVRAIPASLFETAQMEGAGTLAILRHIVMPLCRPILAAMSIFLLIGSMNDFMWQYLLLQRQDQQTLIVGIVVTIFRRAQAQLGDNPIGLSLAGSMTVFVPMAAIFLAFQRYFRGDILKGSIKE